MHTIAFTAPHHKAAEIGYALLQSGASAIDAMVAAAAAISVVYPHMNSVGGDGFWLIHQPGQAPVAIDACGTAAQLATPAFYAGHDTIPTRGGKAAVTLGGTLDGWDIARQWLKSHGGHPRPLAELLEPARKLALDGITVTDSLQRASEKVAADLADAEGYQSVFCPDGRTLRAGDTLHNPGLARLFARLGHVGIDDFYCGTLARELSSWLEANGSPLRLHDFHGYRAQRVAPLQVELRDATIYNLPPPTQGLASLLILAIYDRLHAQHAPQSEGQHVHLLVEAIKQAFMVRDATVTDPSRLAPQWDHCLSTEQLDAMAAAVDPMRASPWPRVAAPGDTVWMGALDRDGCLVSFIQSVYWEFGSGLVHPEYGLTWNNRGISFSLQSDHLNALAPGLKPFHTLNPALALFADGGRLAYGTMGGEGQPQTQAALFSRFHHQKLPLQQAVSRGRWLLGRTWGDSSHDLKLEQDLADVAGVELAQLGHQFRTVPACNEMMGHAGAIAAAADGTVAAASDPRSDGSAPCGSCP